MRLYNWLKFNESIEDVTKICEKLNLLYFRVNEDETVDVDAEVFLNDKNLSYFPIKFNKVKYCFECSGNKLTSLEGSPKEVGDYFNCKNNKLTNLIGSPIKTTSFSCGGNNLTSLKGSPVNVMGHFYCTHNKNLTTLIGGPEYVSGDYVISYNNLYDLRGFPECYKGNVRLFNNPVFEIVKMFKESHDLVIQTINDYNVIRKGNKVDLQLLKYVFDDLGLEFINIEFIKGYEII